MNWSCKFATIISKTLAAGTWFINAGAQLNSSGAATNNAYLRIDDGTNVFASATNRATIGGTTQAPHSLHVSAIVSHTTALAYNLSAALDVISTSFQAKALLQPADVSTGATWFTAVKIG